MRSKLLSLFSLFLALSTASCFRGAAHHASSGLAGQLSGWRVLDLTHSFDSDSPHWKGDPPMRRRTIYSYNPDGFRIEEFCHVGQWGTHLDPPAHFHKGLRFSDEIPVEELVLPLVVIDIHGEVQKNPDYTVSMEDIHRWESKYGEIPKGAFVALRTDWSRRWGSQKEMQNLDGQGIAHYPGWSREVLEYLYTKREVTASGHETTDTDPGFATSRDDYSLESYILGLNRYQVELLSNLDAVPEHGAIVLVGIPKIKKGSGFPVRVLALAPRTTQSDVGR